MHTPEEAEAHMRAALSKRRAALGGTHADVAESLDALAVVLADRLGAKIAYKSDGVPFFVFEILRGLIDGGVVARRPPCLPGDPGRAPSPHRRARGGGARRGFNPACLFCFRIVTVLKFF